MNPLFILLASLFPCRPRFRAPFPFLLQVSSIPKIPAGTLPLLPFPLLFAAARPPALLLPLFEEDGPQFSCNNRLLQLQYANPSAFLILPEASPVIRAVSGRKRVDPRTSCRTA
jgi:hypothetical protein